VTAKPFLRGRFILSEKMSLLKIPRILLLVFLLAILTSPTCTPLEKIDPMIAIDSNVKQGLYKKALHLLDKQISKNPETGYFIVRYRINKQIGNGEEASGDLLDAAAFANRDYYLNGNEAGLLKYALVLLHIGDLERAKAIFEIIKTRHPSLAPLIEGYNEEAMGRVVADGLRIFPER